MKQVRQSEPEFSSSSVESGGINNSNINEGSFRHIRESNALVSVDEYGDIVLIDP